MGDRVYKAMKREDGEMTDEQIAVVVLDEHGNVKSYHVEDSFMEYLEDMGLHTTKEKVLETILKHKNEADILDEAGNVLRPANAIIN